MVTAFTEKSLPITLERVHLNTQSPHKQRNTKQYKNKKRKDRLEEALRLASLEAQLIYSNSSKDEPLISNFNYLNITEGKSKVDVGIETEIEKYVPPDSEKYSPARLALDSGSSYPKTVNTVLVFFFYLVKICNDLKLQNINLTYYQYYLITSRF